MGPSPGKKPLVIGVAGSANASGTPIAIQIKSDIGSSTLDNEASNQLWSLLKKEGELLPLIFVSALPPQSGKPPLVIDITGGKSVAGTLLQVFSSHGGQNQQWGELATTLPAPPK